MPLKKNRDTGSSRLMKIRVFSYLSLAVFFFSGLMVNPANALTPQEKLNQTSGTIDELNSKLKDLKNQSRTIQEILNDLNGQINTTQGKINQLASEIKGLNNNITQKNNEITQANNDLAKQKEIMSEYLRTSYIEGQVSTIELIAKSKNFSEFVDRSEYLSTMQQNVQETANAIVKLQEQLALQKKELEESKAKVQQVFSQQLADQSALSSQRYTRNVLLQQNSALSADYQRQLKKEVQNRADLESLIARLAASYDGTTSASGYAWPFPGYSKSSLVYGVGSFIPFGYSVYYFPGLFHTGIDIYGSAIKSASYGTVAYAGWNGGYGNCVIVRNGNHLVYYGHLASIAVSTGQSVSIGTYLGQEGSTGNSTGPHLHFEIRVNGVATNPLNFLP